MRITKFSHHFIESLVGSKILFIIIVIILINSDSSIAVRVSIGGATIFILFLFIVNYAKKRAETEYWELNGSVLSCPKLKVNLDLNQAMWASKTRPLSPHDRVGVLGRGIREPQNILSLVFKNGVFMLFADDYDNASEFYERVWSVVESKSGNIEDLNKKCTSLLKWGEFNKLHSI